MQEQDLTGDKQPDKQDNSLEERLRNDDYNPQIQLNQQLTRQQSRQAAAAGVISDLMAHGTAHDRGVYLNEFDADDDALLAQDSIIAQIHQEAALMADPIGEGSDSSSDTSNSGLDVIHEASPGELGFSIGSVPDITPGSKESSKAVFVQRRGTKQSMIQVPQRRATGARCSPNAVLATNQSPAAATSLDVRNESPLIVTQPTDQSQKQAEEKAAEAASERNKALSALSKPSAHSIPIMLNPHIGGSIAQDIKLGWRPANPYSGAPIPLYYEFEELADEHVDLFSKDPTHVPIYLGPRIPNSLQVHRQFSKKDLGNGMRSYHFKFPPRPPQIKRKRCEEPRPFTGMNPRLPEIFAAKKMEYIPEQELKFDSDFESGNLDIVQKKSEDSYDLYMRTDTNARGHHQWFYFSVEHGPQLAVRKVTFNIVNFTKDESLYAGPCGNLALGVNKPTGMRIVISRKSDGNRLYRGGEDVIYQDSKLVRRKNQYDPTKHRYFHQLTFTFTFRANVADKVYFSYCFPYTFTRLQNFLRSLTLPEQARGNASRVSNGSGGAEKAPPKPVNVDHLGQSMLCKSLSGVDVPMLTISSRIQSDPLEYNLVKLSEFEDQQESKVSIPLYKRKKFIVVTGRVHPGESNASWMMQGFIKAIMGNSLQAKQLRKRIVFKIIPMLNVDGVIAGNYRTSMSGNDLNRRYLNPDARLHPEIVAVKDLIADLVYGRPSQAAGGQKDEDWTAYLPSEPELLEEDVMAFIDMHGHSRKKNVFIYGPQFNLSSEKYYKSRLIPKLLSEETSMFRYHSCQFKYEHSKRKTARIVLNQEFDIMNCYTLEASFHAHFDERRENFEFSEKTFEEMGEHLVNSLYEYTLIIEEEDRQKQLRAMEKRKRRRQLNAVNSIRDKIAPNAAQSSHAVAATPSDAMRTSQDSQRNSMTVKIRRAVQQVASGLRKKESESPHKLSKRATEEFVATEEKKREACDFAESMRATTQKLGGPSSRQQKSRDGSGTGAAGSESRRTARDEAGYQTNSTAAGGALDESRKYNTQPQARDSSGRGVRTLKDLFKQLDKDESQRVAMQKIEEEELGFKPDRGGRQKASKVLFNEPAAKLRSQKTTSQRNVFSQKQYESDGEEAGNADSEDSDDDDEDGLAAGLKAELADEIGAALNEFSQQYGGNTSYAVAQKRMQQRAREAKIRAKKAALIKNNVQGSMSQIPVRVPAQVNPVRATRKPLGVTTQGLGSNTQQNSQTQSPVKRDRLLEKEREKQGGAIQKKQTSISPTKIQSQPGQRNNKQYASAAACSIQGDDSVVSPRKVPALPQAPPINLSGIKANVPAHIVNARPKDTEDQQQQRVLNRQRMAQQGLLNRIGMRQHVTNAKIMPLRQLHGEAAAEYSSETAKETDVAEVQINNPAPTQSTAQHHLCPLVVNRLVTNMPNEGEGRTSAGSHHKTKSLVTSTSINGNFMPAYAAPRNGKGRSMVTSPTAARIRERHLEKQAVLNAAASAGPKVEHDEVQYVVTDNDMSYQMHPQSKSAFKPNIQMSSYDQRSAYPLMRPMEYNQAANQDLTNSMVQQYSRSTIPAAFANQIMQPNQEGFQFDPFLVTGTGQSRKPTIQQKKMMGRTSLKFQQVIDQHLASNTASRATLYNLFEGQQSTGQNFLTGTRSKMMQQMLPVPLRSPQHGRGHSQVVDSAQTTMTQQTSSCLPDIVNQGIPNGPNLYATNVQFREQLIQSEEIDILAPRLQDTDMHFSRRKAAPFKNNKKDRKSKMSKHKQRSEDAGGTPLEKRTAPDDPADLALKDVQVWNDPAVNIDNRPSGASTSTRRKPKAKRSSETRNYVDDFKVTESAGAGERQDTRQDADSQAMSEDKGAKVRNRRKKQQQQEIKIIEKSDEVEKKEIRSPRAPVEPGSGARHKKSPRQRMTQADQPQQYLHVLQSSGTAETTKRQTGGRRIVKRAGQPSDIMLRSDSPVRESPKPKRTRVQAEADVTNEPTEEVLIDDMNSPRRRPPVVGSFLQQDLAGPGYFNPEVYREKNSFQRPIAAAAAQQVKDPRMRNQAACYASLPDWERMSAGGCGVSTSKPRQQAVAMSLPNSVQVTSGGATISRGAAHKGQPVPVSHSLTGPHAQSFRSSQDKLNFQQTNSQQARQIHDMQQLINLEQRMQNMQLPQTRNYLTGPNTSNFSNYQSGHQQMLLDQTANAANYLSFAPQATDEISNFVNTNRSKKNAATKRKAVLVPASQSKRKDPPLVQSLMPIEAPVNSGRRADKTSKKLPTTKQLEQIMMQNLYED